MAITALASGYRTVVSLMEELSLMLLQPITYYPLHSDIATGTSVTATINSNQFLYVGAKVAVGSGATAETVIVLSIIGNYQFTADFIYAHLANEIVQSATFPSQSMTGSPPVPSDPLLTQDEILSYIARAQNEFLIAVPCVYGFENGTVTVGQIRQSVPVTFIEMERLSSSSANIAISSLTRVSNIVTAISVDPHGLIAGESFSIFGISSPDDTTFIGSFKVATIVDTTTFTYYQVAADSTLTPTVPCTAGLWERAWESSSEQLGLQDPTWRSQNITRINSWFEDRQGLYGYGVNGVPNSNLPVRLLGSIRDDTTLNMVDGFLVPDPLLHAVKYKVLEYVFSKAGEMRNPRMASWCKTRYDRIVLACRRWLSGLGVIPEMAPMASAGGIGGGGGGGRGGRG